MDPEDVQRFLRTSGGDIWALFDATLAIIASDHGRELRARRDSIVERIYAPPLPPPPSAPAASERSRSSQPRGGTARPPLRQENGAKKLAAVTPSPVLVKRSEKEEEEDPRSCGRGLQSKAAGDEESKLRTTKELLKEPDQSEDSLVKLLQNLEDVDVTFKVLQETDIGRTVNGLRKHSSTEVRRLVKLLVRKWMDTVDEWMILNPDAVLPAGIIDEDSPQQLSGKNHHRNGHHQVGEPGHSPNPNKSDGVLSSERNGLEPAEAKAADTAPPSPRREAAPINKLNNSTPSAIVKLKVQEEVLMDEKLASVRKRLQENYQEAENAKKQRTIQVMDIHQIPKEENKKKNSSTVRKRSFRAKRW